MTTALCLPAAGLPYSRPDLQGTGCLNSLVHGSLCLSELHRAALVFSVSPQTDLSRESVSEGECSLSEKKSPAREKSTLQREQSIHRDFLFCLVK